MSAIWVSVSVVAALGAAGLGVLCALVSPRGPGRTRVAVPAMVLMAAATVDMVLPGAPGPSPLAWVTLLVGAALMALFDRRRRVAAAHHATALLLMAVMWVAMLPAAATATATATATAASTAASAAVHGAANGAAASTVPAAAHGGHGLVLAGTGGLLLGALVAAASVVLAVSAVRAARRATGCRGIAVADRLEAAQHVSMAVAMTMMAGGMLLPLTGT